MWYAGAMGQDFWAQYYALRRRIYQDGTSKDYAELDRLRRLAEDQSAKIRHNYGLLGVKGGR